MYTNKSTVILSTQNMQSPFCTCTEGTGVFLIDDHEVLLLSQRCAALSGFGISCIITQWFFLFINLMISKTL